MAYDISKENENTCVIMGIFGVLVSLTCLIQHLTIIAENWLSFLILAVYLLPVIGYILLMKKSRFTDVFLWITVSLLAVTIVLYLFSNVFSLILILLFVYTVISLVLIYILGIKREMNLKYNSSIADQMEWAGKI